MEENLDIVLKKNRNALTKAAYLEILEYMFEEAGSFKPNLVSLCLDDIRAARTSPIGWELYLQHATSIVLKAIDEGIVEDPIEEILDTLLRSEYEDVVHNTLKWKNSSKYVGANSKTLHQLAKRDDWERVLALALHAMSLNTMEDKTGINLKECCEGYTSSPIRPVREGWIELAGYHAREVESLRRVYLTTGIDGWDGRRGNVF